jgi:hypothetical protein
MNEYPRTIDLYLLSEYRNIRVLCLRKTTVSEIIPLANLTNLHSLNLARTNVYDLSPLANLINLRWLNLLGTNIEDISALSGLVNLQNLNLSDTKIRDLSPLYALPNLKNLNLLRTQLSQEQVDAFILKNPYCDVFYSTECVYPVVNNELWYTKYDKNIVEEFKTIKLKDNRPLVGTQIVIGDKPYTLV